MVYLLISFSPKMADVVHDIEAFDSEMDAVRVVEAAAEGRQLSNEVLLWELNGRGPLRRWPKGYPGRGRHRRDYQPLP